MQPVRAAAPSATARHPGLDALRVVATLLVVMLHAGVPYTLAPMPGLTWPVRHTATSAAVDAVFWSIEGAIMPLFFLISGYGAAQSLSSKPSQFPHSRWRRLGWPLVAAAAVLLPIELYLWLIGWAADGQIPLQKLRSLKLGPFHENLWGLSHLWYLEYLLIYSVGLWALRQFVERFEAWQSPPGSNGKSEISDFKSQISDFRFQISNFRSEVYVLRLPLSNLRSLSDFGFRISDLFAAAAVTLWIAPEVVVGFQHSFFPVPAKFVFSGLFFAAGVAQFHRPRRLPWSPRVVLALCGLMFWSVLPLLHRQAAQPQIGTDRGVLAVALAAYAVLVTQSAWQWAQSRTRSVSPLVNYLAGASFWTYLVHHPLVALWHIGLAPTGWPALLQFCVCTLGTLALTLAGYEALVRKTWLGAFLNGRPAIPAAVPAESSDRPSRRAA
jgi:peptidoglycan/LPS O-acetylase OafA/YrhL